MEHFCVIVYCESILTRNLRVVQLSVLAEVGLDCALLSTDLDTSAIYP